MLTDFHAKLYAYELTKRISSDSVEKLTSSLIDAQVDLNPHQIEAALFAFKSPLSNGAILADEVGLGKTIEAGIVLSQKWAERKRRILLIMPSSLRKQWNQELLEKFFLPSMLMEKKSFDRETSNGNSNPFLQDKIVITSYHFARNKEEYISLVPWDLVIIDEAHRLRNVYRTDNKIGKSIKRAINGKPTILLTATPLQNSLLELYGLTSFVDEYTFGDLKSFKSQFQQLGDGDNPQYYDLKQRLEPICIRTLRRQVLEYIKYTNRISITQEFVPTEKEQILYDYVSDYLQRPSLYALPSSQRHLMTLILRKLLASSTFAIAGTLTSLINKLNRIQKEISAARFTDDDIYSDISEDYEEYDEIKDEWEGDSVHDISEKYIVSENEIIAINNEIADLERFRDIAVEITNNAKGDALVVALQKGFQKIAELDASPKAVIFTESRRTQNYIFNVLSRYDEYRNKIIFFNGSNNDDKSKQIYQRWLERYDGTDTLTGSKTADIRAALIDYFKNEASIMIATEAAAEGINLQFCSLVVNYDLPWNPQRIEQRIGRCHRYGQQYDVVVINFLNKNNAADQRVYQLLSEKFKLFEGVFGASDEVLGSIESGVDFEKRISQIYQECRTKEEIQYAFDDLQRELEEKIATKLKSTRQKLLENFDEEVHEKLKINMIRSKEYLNKYETWLWKLTKHSLKDRAVFDDSSLSFQINENTGIRNAVPGKYKIGRKVNGYNIYRLGHPLAHSIIEKYKSNSLRQTEVCFNYSSSQKKISILEPLIGKNGELLVVNIKLESFEVEDYIVFAGMTDNGEPVDEEQCRRMFSLPGLENNSTILSMTEELSNIVERRKLEIIDATTRRNTKFFDDEMEKLEKWADDLKSSIELELKQLDKDIKACKTESKKIINLDEKVNIQRQIKEMEKKRNSMRMNLFTAQDEIEEKKEHLIETVEERMKQHISEDILFHIKWGII